MTLVHPFNYLVLRQSFLPSLCLSFFVPSYFSSISLLTLLPALIRSYRLSYLLYHPSLLRSASSSPPSAYSFFSCSFLHCFSSSFLPPFLHSYLCFFLPSLLFSFLAFSSPTPFPFFPPSVFCPFPPGTIPFFPPFFIFFAFHLSYLFSFLTFLAFLQYLLSPSVIKLS